MGLTWKNLYFKYVLIEIQEKKRERLVEYSRFLSILIESGQVGPTFIQNIQGAQNSDSSFSLIFENINCAGDEEGKFEA